MFKATIYRTSASCGIGGAPSRTVQGALDNARINAGRMFILGLSCTTGERWGYDGMYSGTVQSHDVSQD